MSSKRNLKNYVLSENSNLNRDKTNSGEESTDEQDDDFEEIQELTIDFENASLVEKIRHNYIPNEDKEYLTDDRQTIDKSNKFFNIDFLPGSGYIFRKIIQLVGKGTCEPIPMVIYTEGIKINFSSKTKPDKKLKNDGDTIIFDIELKSEKIFDYGYKVEKWNNGEKNGYETPCHGILLMNKEFISEIENIGKKEGYQIYGQESKNGIQSIFGFNYGNIKSQPVEYKHILYEPPIITVNDYFEDGMTEIKIPILEFTEGCEKFIAKKKKKGVFLITEKAVRFHALEFNNVGECFCKFGSLTSPLSKFFQPHGKDKIYIVPVSSATVEMLSLIYYSCDSFINFFTRCDGFLRIKFSLTIGGGDSIIYVDNRN